jgi:malic enzyme
MADDPIVFVTANPVPKIWPWKVLGAGASIVAIIDRSRRETKAMMDNGFIAPVPGEMRK